MMSPFTMFLVVFLAAALPEVALALPTPFNHIVLGCASGCVAIKALNSRKPSDADEPQAVNVVNPPSDPANVAEVPK